MVRDRFEVRVAVKIGGVEVIGGVTVVMEVGKDFEGFVDVIEIVKGVGAGGCWSFKPVVAVGKLFVKVTTIHCENHFPN